MKTFLSVLVLMTAVLVNAQVKRTNHWYFGYHCGLDFTTGQPVADTMGALESIEGSAVYSDTSGQLRYYSNGEKVWDRNHQLMPNGSGLAGNTSAVQSALFVPVAGSSLVYLFINSYNTQLNFCELRYCIIDGGLNNGNGDIIAGQKNLLLMQNGTEALAGVRHCNGVDHWVVTRRNVQGMLQIYAYRVSGAGIGNPVISGAVNAFSYDVVGQLCFSSDAAQLAASTLSSDLYLYDFDNASGQATLAQTFPLFTNNEMVYSTAFSPDNQKLYVSSWSTFNAATHQNYITQFNLNAAQPWLSGVRLDSVDYSTGSPNGYGFTGRLQQGPDRRIYLCRWNQLYPYQVNPNTFYSLDSLDAVLYPDSLGLSCAFQRNFVYLQGMPTMIGLPNFIATDFDTLPYVPGPCITGTGEMVTAVSGEIRILPNPTIAGGVIQLQFPRVTDGLFIYSSTGALVCTAQVAESTQSELSLPPLAPGVYFVRAIHDQQPTGSGMFVIQ